MDANIVVGVGNIYASESLYLARVRPTREAGRLRPLHWERIYTAIQHILQAAIDKRGTTLSDYVDSEGRQGEFQHQLLVYGREGHPCQQGHPRIQRIVQAGRSSYYCPGCQR
jgi:formamidopyrimidine-DNA glycosylase